MNYHFFICLLLITLLRCSLLRAQQSVGYSYDSSGNRISRTITLVQSASIASTVESDTFKSGGNVIVDNSLGKEIKIFPNPTKGKLIIEIDSKDITKDRGVIAIYNVMNQLVVRDVLSLNSTTLNISSKPSGIYYLIILLNGKRGNWTIIKE